MGKPYVGGTTLNDMYVANLSPLHSYYSATNSETFQD
jgi:hypothetical protein